MATRAQKLASIAQWDAMLARYPRESPFDIVRHLVVVVGANAVTLALLVRGRMQPLAISTAGALVDAVRDRMHWRLHGGVFLSTPGFNAGARWLTLFLGGIPFFVPLAAVVWAVGYCSAKLAAESFIACLPLIASKARAEESAALSAGGG